MKHAKPHAKRHVDIDDGDAFIPDTVRHRAALTDDAEASAEEMIAGITSGDAIAEVARDELDADEIGGAFLDAVTDPHSALYDDDGER